MDIVVRPQVSRVWNCDFSVAYIPEEYSITSRMESESLPSGPRTSVALATLQIEVDIQSHALLYPWGYFPQGLWESGVVHVADVLHQGAPVIDPAIDLVQGVTLVAASEVACKFDERSRWLECLSKDILEPRSALVGYALGSNAVVLVSSRDVLLGIQLHLE
jgi:hypothetical protein